MLEIAGKSLLGGCRTRQGETVREQSIQNAQDLVRRAYTAFADADAERLRGLCHGTIEIRPVDALGLVGDTLRGFDTACDWMRQREELGYRVTIWLGTLEELSRDQVLGVGVVSERGRGCAATVAWIWHVRDGLIDSVHGYPNEAAARRSLSWAS